MKVSFRPGAKCSGGICSFPNLAADVGYREKAALYTRAAHRSEVMRQDQLDKARLARWRQDGNALLTLDDAERWLAETPLCVYLPRRQHLPVPAPSFVEAIAGRADATPGPEHIAAAAQMLARLVASGAVIALNLFGAAPGIGVTSFVGEHPDFLATPEALPYLYALQPERNPKRPPTTVGGARVSPLAAEAYTLLEREGALTTIELRSRLGREVTEAAVLRSLAELWHTMRVVPVPADNPQEGAHWELLSARHRRELNIGSTQSQTTALSILVSFYLQSAISATAEEVEIFLSPLASRSRIRDVVHGLSTTRQLASFSLAGDEQFYVEGTLPESRKRNRSLAPLRPGEDAGLEQNEPDLTEAAAANPLGFSRTRPQFRAVLLAPLSESVPAAASPRAIAARHPQVGDRHRQIGPRAAKAASVVRNEAARVDLARDDSRGSYRRPEGAEGTDRPPRPNFERRARPNFANASESRERPARSGGPSRPRIFDRPNRFGRPDRPERGGAPRGSFEKGRPPRPAGGSFRRDRPFGDRPPRSADSSGRFRPGAAAGPPRFSQDRPGRPPRDAGRPARSFGGGEGRGASRPDRPFRKPQGDRPDRPTGGPRRFEGRPPAAAGRPGAGAGRSGGFNRPPRRDGESRPPFRTGESRPQEDRPFKRPYASAGDRPPGRGSAGSYGKFQATVQNVTSLPVPGLKAAVLPHAPKAASGNPGPSALPVSDPAGPADSASPQAVRAASESPALADPVPENPALANREAIVNPQPASPPLARPPGTSASLLIRFRPAQTRWLPQTGRSRQILRQASSRRRTSGRPRPEVQGRAAPRPPQAPACRAPGGRGNRALAHRSGVRPQRDFGIQATRQPSVPNPGETSPGFGAPNANRVAKGTKDRCPLHDRRSSSPSMVPPEQGRARSPAPLPSASVCSTSKAARCTAPSP